jgi:hypothetical protein
MAGAFIHFMNGSSEFMNGMKSGNYPKIGK